MTGRACRVVITELHAKRLLLVVQVLIQNLISLSRFLPHQHQDRVDHARNIPYQGQEKIQAFLKPRSTFRLPAYSTGASMPL